MGNSIDYIRIATIQFPFIPVIVHPGYNTLSEPEGNINFWVIGNHYQKTKTNVSTLASLLKFNDINTEILKNLQSDYIEWLVLTVKEILRFICNRENPDIILLPEYSLPYEESNELRDILSDYSEKRCIVGGIGSVNHNGKQKKNKFVVINDGNIQFGEKVVPNADEEKIGIEPGNGPLLHELTLQPDEGKEVLAMITMCSDFIGSLSGPVRRKLSQELTDKGLNDEDIDITLVPMFTTKTKDMQQIASVEAGRNWRITALANCSFFGETHIRFYPIKDVEGLEEGSSSMIKRDGSACIVAEVPYPPVQVIQPKSRPIRVGSGNISIPQFGCRTYNIKFKNEERENNNSIELDTESFLTLINNRIYKAITYAGIILMGNSHDNERNNCIIATMNAWKKLEEEIVSLIPFRPIRTYENLPKDIIPYLDKIIFGYPYITVVDAIHEFISPEKYKRYLEEIKSYISSEDLLSLDMWFNMRKGNDENGQ